MLPLAHLGIGRRIAAPWATDLPLRYLYLGTLLPDLIDKPIYALASLITGRKGYEIGWISGTRMLGHSLLLTVIVAFIGTRTGSKVLKALGLGMLTHLVLDATGDIVRFLTMPRHPIPLPPGIHSEGIFALLWPLLGLHFPSALNDLTDVRSYMKISLNWSGIVFELLGATLLAMDSLRWWRTRRDQTNAAR